MKFRLKTPSKRSRAKSSKISSSWKLLKASFREYKSGLKRYLLILAIVAVPINLLAIVPGLNDPTAGDPISSFTPFIAIIMNVALIWAIVRHHDTGKMPTVAEAYYDGSASLVRYLLVTSVIVIMLIPAAFAATFYSLGVISSSANGSSTTEQLLILFVTLVLAVPSLYLIVRHALAPFAAVREGLRPMASLRVGRALTRGRFWAVAGRLAMLVLFLAILSIPATLITIGLSMIHVEAFALVFFEIASTLVALPIANLYLFNLYRELERTIQTISATETETGPANSGDTSATAEAAA